MEFSNLPLADFNGNFTAIATTLSNTFNAIDFICPAWLVIIVFGVIIYAEIILLGFKGAMAVANLMRGSGA